MQQGRLFEFRMGERSPDTLVVTEANREAAHLLTQWRTWPNGTLALVGPHGAGKTHLALAWAVETGARHLAADASPDEGAALFRETGGRLVIDDADGQRDEAMLWRVLDLARGDGGAVLLVGASLPRSWPVASPDLASRLASLAVARLQEPDQVLMEVVLRRFCREHFILLRDDAARFLALRLPRTFAAAHLAVAALEADLVKGAKPVALKAARAALEKVQAASGGEDG
jgi:chromosomal replication initiation ATPase DnaA